MAGARQGRHKIANWAKYNQAFVERGSLTLWISAEVIANWKHANVTPRRPTPRFARSIVAFANLGVWPIIPPQRNARTKRP